MTGLIFTSTTTDSNQGNNLHLVYAGELSHKLTDTDIIQGTLWRSKHTNWKRTQGSFSLVLVLFLFLFLLFYAIIYCYLNSFQAFGLAGLIRAHFIPPAISE